MAPRIRWLSAGVVVVVVVVVVVFSLLILPAKCQVNLRDGSARIIVRAVTLRQNVRIKCAITPVTVH